MAILLEEGLLVDLGPIPFHPSAYTYPLFLREFLPLETGLQGVFVGTELGQPFKKLLCH